MNLLSLAPEALVAIIVLVGLAWLFEDRVGFSKGVRLGPYEWILKTATERVYYRMRRSVSDVSALILQDPADVLAEIKAELQSPYFKELEDTERKKHIESTFKKFDLNAVLHDENFGIQAFVLGGLLRSPLLLYVMSRKKDKKTGEPRPFPSGQALVAKRAVVTLSGMQSRRLVEGDFYLLPKKHKFEGLLRKPTPVGLFVAEEDSNDRDLISHMEKITPALQDVAKGIRTERQYGIIVKDLSRRLKSALSEQKRLVNRLRTAAGDSMADKKTTDFYERRLPKGAKIGSSLTPVVLFAFPILGALVFEYGLHSNPIFGVIVGGSLVMVVLGTRGL